MAVYETPEKILQDLIRFDTTNPPGNERACIEYIQQLLGDAGIETTLYAKVEQRPNLVARIKGRGEAPPLMLYGHVDVVTTAGQDWRYPPFGAEIHDGFVWGRGALDMKGGVAMMIAALLRLKAEEVVPAGDLILLVLADEENYAEFGARFMVEAHPEVFEGVRYALGEFGGFNITLAGKRFYPIQVAEKQVCGLELKFKGPSGHGAMPAPECAAIHLGYALDRIYSRRMPVHVTAPVRGMVGEMARSVGGATGLGLRALLQPALTDKLLDRLGEIGLTFVPMFHNTVNATIFQGGEKRNVVPSEIRVELDGRMLPGVRPEQMIAEVRELIGLGEEDVEIRVLQYEPGPEKIDLGLFDHLAGVLKQLDPEGIPVPYLLTAVTDGRHLAKLGIQSYGFIPMQLPEDFEFFKLAHAADERIPVEAVRFGAEGIYQAVREYRG